MSWNTDRALGSILTLSAFLNVTSLTNGVTSVPVGLWSAQGAFAVFFAEKTAWWASLAVT